jgi:hypothetical protein
MLSYFMLIAIYLFARKVVEVCGQLNRLQGTVKTEQIKRKIAAIHGEREAVLRSTRYTLGIIAELGLLKPTKVRGVYSAGTIALSGYRFTAFVLTALLCSLDRKHGIGRS